MFFTKNDDGTFTEIASGMRVSAQELLESLEAGAIIKVIPADITQQDADDYYDIEDARG